MANVSFAPEDKRPSLDGAIESASESGKAIRVRCQPDVYDYEKGNYQTWTGLSWIVECQDVEEGRRLREGLTDFFKAFGGQAAMQERVLNELKRMARRG